MPRLKRRSWGMGASITSRVLGCDPKTIRQGQAELEGGDDLDTGRVRKKLHWQTWGETAFFELTEIPGGVTSEASLLAAAFPALVQVGTQPLPIIYIPCPQFEPFLWTQPRGQARHHAHRPLHHQTRRRLFASTGTPLMIAMRAEQVFQVVVRPRDVG